MSPRSARVRSRSEDLRAGALLGLISSTYSTLFVQAGAKEIGRDPKVDWMEVGTVLLRGRALRSRPGAGGIAAGIVLHQFADFMWAVLFFGGLIPRVPPDHRGRYIVAAAVPWAAASSAIEYYLVLPWLQQWLRMQVPYWTAFGVHVSSSAAYPLFLVLRGQDRRGLGRITGIAAAATVAGLATMRGLTRRGKNPHLPLMPGGSRDYDRRFLHHMTGHHEVGLELATLAAERGGSEPLRALGRLMAAEHAAELDIMRTWHRNWFGSEVPPLTAEQREEMPGMPPPDRVAGLRELTGPPFDRAFASVMIPHHFGAIRMANDALRQGSDPRLRLFADGIRHTQLGQIRVMDACT